MDFNPELSNSVTEITCPRCSHFSKEDLMTLGFYKAHEVYDDMKKARVERIAHKLEGSKTTDIHEIKKAFFPELYNPPLFFFSKDSLKKSLNYHQELTQNSSASAAR